VKGADSINHRVHVLVITSSVSMGVVVVDKSSSVKRLVDISDVVDDQSQGEGLLVHKEREGILNLLVVSCGGIVTSLGQEVGQSVESLNIVYGVQLEIGIVSDGFACLVDVRLVDEVPSTLPAVSLALNDISKSSAFDKRMASFSRCETRVV